MSAPLSPQGFDWAAMMQIGLGELRLLPSAFWALTPAEFMLLSGLHKAAKSRLSRARFLDLYAQFPDDTHPMKEVQDDPDFIPD